MTLQAELDHIAESSDFSGVMVVEDSTETLATVARGHAVRPQRQPIGIDTRFGVASVTKGFTALTIMSLIESEKLTLDTPLAEVAGPALSTDPGVTIEHLLGHTSGVGDHLDEEALNHIDDHVLGGMSAHRFERPHHYLPLLNQHPQVFPPGDRFAYNNGGYVILALVAERVGGKTFPQLVRERVFEPAGMTASDFFRSDDLPADTALGYLENGRTNVFHLPVIGSGDGGAYTTAEDLARFWQALVAGRIISSETVETMTAIRQILPSEQRQYGLGFWLAAEGNIIMLEGLDAGVSAQTAFDRRTGVIGSALSNTSSGVWPLFNHLLPVLDELAGS